MARLFMIVLLYGFAGCLLIFGMTGCGAQLITDPSQIRLAIYTPACIDVEGANVASGAHLLIYACGDGKRSQTWTITPLDGQQYNTVVNENSQMCMSVAAEPDDQNPAEAVIQATCDKTDPDMLWMIVPATAGNGVTGWQFVNRASGQCLDLPYSAVDAPDTLPLQQYTCTASDPAQVWNVNPVQVGTIP